MNEQLPDAGWYPDAERDGQERFWDGQQWTDRRREVEQSTGLWWKILVAGVLMVGVAALAGVDVFQGDEDTDRSPSGGTGRPGVESVYEQIESTRDCSELQATFDRAMDNVDRYEPGDGRRQAPLSYAEAADDRMRQIGCYD